MAPLMSREAEKPKKKSSDEVPTLVDSPSGSRFVRQYQFDQSVYGQFEHETEQRGATPGGIFRKVMQDYLKGFYLTIDDLTPETLEELRRYAKETHGSARNMQAAMSAILNKWAASQSENHGGKKV